MTDTRMSQTISSLATALIKAQTQMGKATKKASGQVGQNRGYKYADLANVTDAYKQAFAAQGLSIIQRSMSCESGVKIQTMIIHTSGEWIADEGLHLPATKQDAQSYGSAMTYARRYGLSALVGIITEDDDGRAAIIANQITEAQRENLIKIGLAAGYPEAQLRVKAAKLQTRSAYEQAIKRAESALEELTNDA